MRIVNPGEESTSDWKTSDQKDIDDDGWSVHKWSFLKPEYERLATYVYGGRASVMEVEKQVDGGKSISYCYVNSVTFS